MIDSLPLDQYAIDGDAPAWEEAEKQLKGAVKDGKSAPVISVKSSKSKRKAATTATEVFEEAFGDKSSRKKAKKDKGKKA
ncbi:hypothetical protein NQ176_g11417 [Zarea fungicola]|uniref:Uncharacterized protein n=1 Tax=Zarea fungicola TaxID=93591 RepID=A0ACC1MCF1_9HYPO|nr:hypothetical protein NQ176_g11417 [Lecanicillium fungicola]